MFSTDAVMKNALLLISHFPHELRLFDAQLGFVLGRFMRALGNDRRFVRAFIAMDVFGLLAFYIADPDPLNIGICQNILQIMMSLSWLASIDDELALEFA